MRSNFRYERGGGGVLLKEEEDWRIQNRQNNFLTVNNCEVVYFSSKNLPVFANVSSPLDGSQKTINAKERIKLTKTSLIWVKIHKLSPYIANKLPYFS